MLGVSIGYHRYLAHKSFKAVRWFEILIVFLGIPAGTPVQWAGNHRAHHMFTDTEKDPHSPHHGGFWWAHTGWYLGTKNKFLCILYALAGPLRTLFDAYYRPRTNQQYNHYAKDILSDPVLSWMSRPRNYFVLVMIHTLSTLCLVYMFLGIRGLLVTYLCYLYVYNMGDAVDSVGHIWGARNSDSRHLATNNFFLGPFAFGDGWHSNHHDNPAKARHGKAFWQLDPSYYTLRFLSYFGIVTDIKY